MAKGAPSWQGMAVSWAPLRALGPFQDLRGEHPGQGRSLNPEIAPKPENRGGQTRNPRTGQTRKTEGAKPEIHEQAKPENQLRRNPKTRLLLLAIILLPSPPSSSLLRPSPPSSWSQPPAGTLWKRGAGTGRGLGGQVGATKPAGHVYHTHSTQCSASQSRCTAHRSGQESS